MKTIVEYQDDIRALLKKAEDIDAQVMAEGRDPSDQELAMKNELLSKIEEIKTIMDTAKRQERLKSELLSPEAPKTAPVKARVQVGEDLARTEKFGSFGQMLTAVFQAGLPSGKPDPRLFNATGLNETTPSDGGFLVQQDFSSELLQEVFNTGVLASRCRRIQISGNANSIKINGLDESSRATGSRGGGIRGYWVEEAGQKTASQPSFRKIELNLKKLVGLCYTTDELLADASALEGVIRSGFVSEFGFLMDDAILNGTGNGQPLGVLNSGCLVTQAKENQQAADTIVAENIIKMYSRLFAGSRANAAWFINQSVEPELMKMSLAVGTGGQLIYMPPGGLSQSPYGTLLGLPVIALEQCAALGDVGDIVLGDFSNGYILAEKGGIKTDMSIHVKFDYDQSVFRFVMRVDGQPVRATAMTPYKGGATATMSHFVALAAR
jgi:HK97 family phage major capsid protein